MNPYKVLGVRPNASLDEIENAYESLTSTYSINNFHGSLEEPLAEDKLYEINEAYTLLTNNLKYKDIRNLIERQQFLNAETELNLISDKTSAEWNYLKGFVLLKKGWFQAGVNHLKTAAELNPSNEEYQETLMILAKKVKQMKVNYARAMQSKGGNSSNMCGGGGQSNNMCGGSGSGGGIDPNILNMLMNSTGGNPMGGANPMDGGNSAANPMGNMGANPMANMGTGMGGGNPMQNMLMQSLLGGGGNGMNMCGNSGGGGMC